MPTNTRTGSGLRGLAADLKLSKSNIWFVYIPGYANLYFMSKSSLALTTLPPEATVALATLGEHLAVARLRRNESQRQWAQRIGVSIPTLARMENGDPTVSLGVYATALWLLGLAGGLAELASPDKDVRALEASVRTATRTRAARKQVAQAAQRGKPRRPDDAEN